MTAELLKVHDLIEKLQEIEKENGNIPVVIEDNYDRYESDWKNLLTCDVLVWDHDVTENGYVVSDFDLTIDRRKCKKLPVVHIG